MAVVAGGAVVVDAASFAATTGMIEIPIVDGVTIGTVGSESGMVGRRVMAGGAGRGKPYKYTRRMATGAG